MARMVSDPLGSALPLSSQGMLVRIEECFLKSTQDRCVTTIPQHSDTSAN